MSGITNPPVFQSGTVTPRHFAVFTTDGVIQDAGDPVAPFATSGIGIQSSNATSINIANDPITGPYNALSLGITPTAANLTVNSFNGAQDIPFNIIVNGNVFAFPGPSGPFLPLAGGIMAGAVALAGISTAPTATPGTSSDQIATTAFVAGVVIGPTGQGNIGRNYLFNSLFNIAQRGAGPFTTNGYTLDQWAISATTDTFSVQQAFTADAGRIAIGNEAAIFALSNNFIGNAAAGAFTAVTQPVENVRRLAGNTVTVSFYAVAAAGTPKLGVSIDQFFGTGGSPSATVQGNGTAVTIGTTYARYSATLAIPSIIGKTLGSNNNDFTQLRIWYSAGATNAVRAGNIGVQTAIINIWGVQLEISNAATILEQPTPRYDLSNCQRYYYVTQIVSGGYAVAGTLCLAPYGLPVAMRASPTLVITNFTGTSNITGVAITPVIFPASNRDLFGSGTVIATGAYQINFLFTASAEL